MIDALESTMLAAFSIGWYFSIFKMIRTREVAGKSLGFVVLVFIGYICGVTAKGLYWLETGLGGAVLAVYVWNTLVVALDIALVIYISRHPRAPIGPSAEPMRMPAGAR